jgi:hypothetical protein
MLDLNVLEQVSALSQQTFNTMQDKINEAGFSQGQQEDLFGDKSLYWKPIADADKKPASTQVIYRILPQPYSDVKAIEDGTFNIENIDQFKGLNFINIPYYQIYQSKISSKGIKGGKFECISPSLWGEEDLLFKFIREVYNERYGHFTKGTPERKDGIANWLNKYKPKNTFKTNILVLQDTTMPERVGKVWMHDIDQFTLRKRFFGDTSTKDLAGSFLSTTDDFGDPIVPTDVLNAVTPASKDVVAGGAISLKLVYETKNFGRDDVLVTNFEKSKVEIHKHQTLYDDVAEFITKGNIKTAKQNVSEYWQQEHSLLKYYDRSQYYIEPQKMVDNFCEFLNIDDHGNTRKDQTITIGSSTKEITPAATIENKSDDTDIVNSTYDMDAMLDEMMNDLK